MVLQGQCADMIQEMINLNEVFRDLDLIFLSISNKLGYLLNELSLAEEGTDFLILIVGIIIPNRHL